jgi:GGDEF domain-containing protein
LTGTPKEAEALVGRIQKWVFGEYTIEVKGSKRKVKVSAAIGMAVAAAGEPGATVIGRADAEMYRDKARANGTPSLV